MENKYYINEDGLIVLIQSISNSIIQHTSGEITFTESTNPVNGQTTKSVDNPNNFPTVKAVTDYLKNRKNLKVKYDSNSAVITDSYETTENEKLYNGEEEIQVDMKLVTSEDIANLF